MMQAAHIPLGHLYSSGPQVQHQYSPEEEELVNMLVNRDQYLQDQQSAEVGKLMSAVRQPDVIYPLKQKALGRINKFREDLKGLYLTQRSKKKLSAENLLKAQQLKSELDFDLSAMDRISKDFDTESRNIGNYASQGYIDPQTEQNIYKAWVGKLQDPSLDLTNIPLYSAEIAAVVHPKMVEKKQKEAIDELKAWETPLVDSFKGRSYTDPTDKQITDAIQAIYPNESFANVRAKYNAVGVIPAGMSDADALKTIASRIKAQSFNKEKAPGTTVYNNYGVRNPVTAPYVKDGDKTVWEFPKKDISYTKDKVPGYLTAVYKQGDKWYGEFSVDKMIDVPKEEWDFFTNANKQKKDRFGNDVYPVELDASDYGKVMAAGYNLEDGEKYNWNGLGKQRTRTSKSKDAKAHKDNPFE